MWILYVVLFLAGLVAVGKYNSLTEQMHALRIYAADLLLRPEQHRMSAEKLREIMLRAAHDPRGADKAVDRALHQWAAETAATR